MIRKADTIAVATYAVIALLLSRFPLFNILGYEFSVVIAVAAAFVAGFSTIRHLNLIKPELPVTYVRAIGYRLIIELLLLLIPLLIITFNLLFVRNCSYLEGLAFYALIPLVTVLLVVPLAGCLWMIFKRSRTALALLLLLCATYPLIVGYATPQIYSYNVIYGFFPGFSYDEVLTITPLLLAFRGLTLVAALLCVAMSGTLVTQRLQVRTVGSKIRVVAGDMVHAPYRVLKIAALLLIAGAFVGRTYIGFETSRSSIEDVLSATVYTDHFEIRYKPSSFSEEEVVWVAAEHEYQLAVVESLLQTSSSGVIRSYIYPSEHTKRAFIGAGSTNIAKPWRREIHVNRASWNDVLRHELVHVVAGEFGIPVMRANLNIGLVEGLATGIDDNFGNRTLHEYAAGMKKFGIITDPSRFLHPLMFAQGAATATYVAMGSFCKYLIDTLGVGRFKALYGGESAKSVYGKSLDDLAAGWWAWLDLFSVQDTWKSHYDFYFRRPSIFAKECARAVALLNERGWNALARNNGLAAVAWFRKSLGMNWTSTGYAGLIRALYQSARYDSLLFEVGAIGLDSIRDATTQSLSLLICDAYWMRGDDAEARNACSLYVALDVTAQSMSAAYVRWAVLQDSSLRRILPEYFNGGWSDSISVSRLRALGARSHNPLCTFLLARTYLRSGRDAEADRAFSMSASAFADSLLVRIAKRGRAEALFRMRDFKSAAAVYADLCDRSATLVERERLEAAIHRCVWYHEIGERYVGTGPLSDQASDDAE